MKSESETQSVVSRLLRPTVGKPDTSAYTDLPSALVASGAEFRSRLDWFIGVSDGSAQDPGALTYEPYFGLREKPFSLASDPRFFCRHSSHGAAFDTLAAGI